MSRILAAIFFAAPLLGLFSGCSSPKDQAPSVVAQAHIARPANPNDIQAWRTYMGKVVDPTASPSAGKPYKFLVPSADDPIALGQRKQVEEALTIMASNNSFPGNVIAVGGPDPTKTADVMVAAFVKAKPDSLKAITVLYVGNDANQARVQKVITGTGATFRYTSM